MVRRLLGLVALGAAVAGAACRSVAEDPNGSTLERRARSLVGHERVIVAGEPMADFAARRVLVVHGVERVGWNEFRLHGGRGSAAAVTTDGYVLTAAHVLVDRAVPPTLLNMRCEPPVPYRPVRVVWSGWKAGRDGPDLALVHVDGRALRVEAAFGLAALDVAAVATRVYSAGFADPEGTRLPAAGEVLDTRRLEPARPGEPAVLEVWTRVPLRQGDSGGPTFDPAGRLVGITSGGRWIVLDGWSTLTLLPDATWLQERIEADRRAQAAR